MGNPMKNIKRSVTAAITMGFCLVTSASLADSPFTDGEAAIEYRQNALSLMHKNFAVMGDMIKGDIEYDDEIFVARAEDFAKLASIPWVAFSVEGAMPGENTDALPAIWDNWDDFQERANEFQTHADQLADVAIGARDQAKDAFMTVAQSCKGCHDNYRD